MIPQYLLHDKAVARTMKATIVSERIVMRICSKTGQSSSEHPEFNSPSMRERFASVTNIEYFDKSVIIVKLFCHEIPTLMNLK